jgi:hypothetical protein
MKLVFSIPPERAGAVVADSLLEEAVRSELVSVGEFPC